MDMSGYEPLPLVDKFMPFSTLKQGNKVVELMRVSGYSFIRFMLNGESHSVVAVLESSDNIVLVYPDGYLDTRDDRSIAITREF